MNKPHKANACQELRSTGTVLIVEPDQDIRAAIGAILGVEGYGIALAANLSEAQARVIEHRPAFILLAGSLTEPPDGWGSARFKRQWHAIPTAVMTTADRARAEGAAATLSEPPATEELMRVVQCFAGAHNAMASTVATGPPS